MTTTLTITLYNCGSDPRVINKTMHTVYTTTATPFGDVSIMSPTLRLRQSGFELSGLNYLYIAQWARYYFIDDIRLISGDLLEITCHIDVLMTYATAILDSEGICIANENKGKIIQYADGSTVQTSDSYVNDKNQPLYPYVIQSVYEFDTDVFNTDKAGAYSRNYILNVSGGTGE